MNLHFVNRVAEQAELNKAGNRGGLYVVFGRRRVGKTRLLRHWLDRNNGMYSQAIESQRELQVQQLFDDIQPQLSTQIVPKTWVEFLEILSVQKKRWTLCIDEFPYLTATDPSLPSVIQRFIDHSLPKGCLLLLAGSSLGMMNDLFLNRAAPLFGRAHKLLHVQPMDYGAFCDACSLRPGDVDAFEKFACVGGIPKYWEFVEAGQNAAALADGLYFDTAAYMEQEPQRVLRDEGINGLSALAVLEAVGRGAERPSEISSRLATQQTNLSRVLQQLIDPSILLRELPYGESLRTTKKTLYRIADPTIRFWFHVYSPHRSRWHTYSAEQRSKLVHDHASTVFEDVCRARYPGSARYWEGDIELDIVAPDPEGGTGVIVAEVKWRKLTVVERRQLLAQLEHKWQRTQLSRREPKARFEVLDSSLIRSLE